MRKILLLALGGTIACVPTKRGLMPKLRARELIAQIRIPWGVAVTGEDFLKRTVLFPQDWNAVATKIFREYDAFDGFVITLGTDSLAYTAAALSLALQNLSKPVVLTGAMRPLHHPRTDAKKNLRAAIAVAAKRGVGGVCVVFNGAIMPGATVSKVRSDSVDAFESINEKPLGHVRGQKVMWLRRSFARRGRLRLAPHFEMNVANITLMPQTQPQFVRALKKYRGVLVEGYGDGNVPSNLIRDFKGLALKKVLVLASQCAYGAVGHHYEGGSALVRAGALSADAMTKETALVKLMWALGQAKSNKEARRIFSTYRVA